MNKMNKVIIYGIGIALSSSALAESVIPSSYNKNVVESPNETTIHKQPLVGPVQPLQMQPIPTNAQQSGQSNASRVLGGQALEMHNQYVLPNVGGMPSYFASLLTAIIQDRNPMWDPSFDEGKGQRGYGFGLALVTESTGISYGVDRQQLFDANTNVRIALRILSRGRQKFGDDVNSIVGWYILGDPKATDPRVQKVLELFKQLEGK